MLEGTTVWKFVHCRDRKVQAAAGVRMLSLGIGPSKPKSVLFVLSASVTILMAAQSAAQVSHLDQTVLAEVPYLR
jgi:hypothetical protein